MYVGLHLKSINGEFLPFNSIPYSTKLKMGMYHLDFYPWIRLFLFVVFFPPGFLFGENTSLKRRQMFVLCVKHLILHPISLCFLERYLLTILYFTMRTKCYFCTFLDISLSPADLKFIKTHYLNRQLLAPLLFYAHGFGLSCCCS